MPIRKYRLEDGEIYERSFTPAKKPRILMMDGQKAELVDNEGEE